MTDNPLYDGPPKTRREGPATPWTQLTWVGLDKMARLSYHDNGDPQPIPRTEGKGEFWPAATRFHNWSSYFDEKTVHRLSAPAR